MSSDDAEHDALEFILGLDALQLGLGGKAFGLYQRCLSRDVRPLLLRQKVLLDRSINLGVDVDDDVMALESEITAAWKRCIEQLRILWSTDSVESAGGCHPAPFKAG